MKEVTNKKVFQILVDNTSGVLSRISGLFSRRGYNIESITAGVTAEPTITRITIVASGDDDIMEQIEKKAEQSGKHGSSNADSAASASDGNGDELLPAAVDVILETGQASVSMLQRKIGLGFSRAGKLIDEMEKRGIVGPYQGSKPREVLKK